MSKKFQFNNHSTQHYSDNIAQICQPLCKILGITYFNFLRRNNDNSRICLTNKPQWPEHYCAEKYYLDDTFELPLDCFSNGYFIWDMLQHTKIYRDARDNFQIKHMITLVDKSENHCDFYHFGVLPSIRLSNDCCIRNLELLRMFILFFNDKAIQLIKTSDRIYFPDAVKTDDNSAFDFSSSKQAFVDSLNIKRYYLGGVYENIYLTPKELRCIKLSVSGYSSSHISQEINRSKKTVENHLAKVKEKLACKTLSHLIAILANTDIASLIFNAKRI